MQRRRFVLGLAGTACLAAALPVRAAAETIRIGLTPVFLDDQVAFLNEWRAYLAFHLGQAVEFIQRGNYREIVDLILQDRIHYAWLCGFPYVRHRPRVRLLAVPIHAGRPLYQSYLIVPRVDTITRSVFDLKDRVFAYSDPDSNSGFLYPQYQLRKAGLSPDRHFLRSFFTYSHRNVVEAVAARVAHGGAVDGYVWDTLQRLHPDLVRRTRIADRSPDFGFPPLVAAPGVSGAALKKMQAVLFGMHATAGGQALLTRLNLDRFEAAAPQLFDGIDLMVRFMGAQRS